MIGVPGVPVRFSRSGLRRLCFLVLVVPLCVACDSSTEPDQLPAAFSIIDGLRVDLEEAHSEGDVQALATLFAPNGSLMLPDEPRIDGRAAIRDRYADFFAAFDVDLSLVGRESSVLDGELVDRGTYELTLTPVGGGPAIHFEGPYAIDGTLGDGGVRIDLLRFESSP